MTEAVRSLACRTCAAPLELRGGHKVRTLTCGYCGSVMDVQDEFRVLAQYQNMQRPDCPISIGMSGRIKDVDFTVIGMIQSGYRDAWGDDYAWVSLQLFSATHGYAWLTWNEGHFVFSRRVRDLPEPGIPFSFRPRKSRVRHRDRKLRYYESYEAGIQFVEGELTWQASLGDQVKVHEYIDPPFSLEYEESDEALEYGLSEYMPRKDVMAAFGVEGRVAAPRGIHPLQPFMPGALGKAVASVGYVFAIISACLVIFAFVLGAGSNVVRQELAVQQGQSRSVNFDLARATQLVQVRLQSDVSNAWTFVETEILDASGAPVAGVAREIGYYFGIENGENWDEGSRDTSIFLRLPQAGSYSLALSVDAQAQSPFRGHVIIREGVMPLRYLVALTVLFTLAAVSLFIRRLRFEKRRWAEVLDDD